MFTNTERNRETFANGRAGKVRRNDRRNAIARKAGFLIDALSVRVHD